MTSGRRGGSPLIYLLESLTSTSEHMQEWEWKRLRKLKEVALERLCGRALAELEDLLAKPRPSHHKRFLQIFQHIHERNDDIAEAFDDMRRSTATYRLSAMRALGVVTETELAEFSDQTRETVEFLARELYGHLTQGRGTGSESSE